MSEPTDADTLIVNRCTHERGITTCGTIKCGKCGEDCWIAPTSIAVLKKAPQMRVLCLECTAEYGSVKEIHMAPGAAEEIAEALRKDRKR